MQLMLAALLLAVSAMAQPVDTFYGDLRQVPVGPVLTGISVKDPIAFAGIQYVQLLFTQTTNPGQTATGSTNIYIPRINSAEFGLWFARNSGDPYNPNWIGPLAFGSANVLTDGLTTLDLATSGVSPDPADVRKGTFWLNLTQSVGAPKVLFALSIDSQGQSHVARLAPKCPQPTVSYEFGCPVTVSTRHQLSTIKGDDYGIAWARYGSTWTWFPDDESAADMRAFLASAAKPE